MLAAVFGWVLALGVNTPSDAVATIPLPRSYLALPTGGRYAAIPYVWERSAHGKRLAVIGTRHLRNAQAPQFDRIEAVIDALQPQLVLHEGFAPEALQTLPLDQAIALGADLSFTVHAAHRRGLPLRSADAPVADEIKALLAQYSAQDVLVFIVTQRLLGNVRKPDLAAAQKSSHSGRA